jgi:elongation factor 4
MSRRAVAALRCGSKRLPECTLSTWFSTQASSEYAGVREEGGSSSVCSNEQLLSNTRALESFPPLKIRNFSIIAHIDHGKSTLADRMMECTGMSLKNNAARVLDTLQVEKERGITVKAQTSSLVYAKDGEKYLLNLIDTPGHVDFSYEVSRSLAACDGCLLLVDASQGVEAQTVANFFLAFEQNLAIIPVLNKIDMPAAEPERVSHQLEEQFDLPAKECVRVSAKTGCGVDGLLRQIVERVPPPSGNPDGNTRMLVFDAYHDEYRGVVCLVNVVDGLLRKGDKIVSKASGDSWDVIEVGVLTPVPRQQEVLCTGQVGYVLTGMKETRSAKIGDTWHIHRKPVDALPGFREPKSMVTAAIFPANAGEFDLLQGSMSKLTLNDSSVSFKRENSNALGAGFRCGFLGLLHMDVFKQRLEQEHGASVIVTAPTVPVKIKRENGEWINLENPADFPLKERIRSVLEPTILATIVLPSEALGSAMTLCQQRRGELEEHVNTAANRVMLRYVLPLSELGGDFYDELKSLSSGYASFDYEMHDMREADLVRMDILVNGEPVDALARIVHRSRASKVGRDLCQVLKQVIDRAQFDVAIQAAASGKIVARETIKAYRKNVLAKCYGGDITRKKKLLEKQKAGKRRLRKLGSIEIETKALHTVMQTR